MEVTAIVLTGMGLIMTVMIAIVNSIRDRINKNEKAIENLRKELEKHMVDANKQFTTKEELNHRVELMTTALKQSVDYVTQDVKDLKNENKKELASVNHKLDLLLEKYILRSNRDD